MEELGINKFFPKREQFKYCEACMWYFDHFEPKYLETFYNSFRGVVCVIPKPNAVPSKETGITYYDERLVSPGD